MFTWRRGSARKPLRGPLYRIGLPGFLSVEHAAFALGVGRKALEATIDLAQSKKRGFITYSNPLLLSTRLSFQSALGRCDFRLRAARSLAVEIFDAAWITVCQGDEPGLEAHAEMRSAGTFATEVAADIVTDSLRYGGGTALYSSNVMQQCLRDIQASAQHYMVNESAYGATGRYYWGCLMPTS